MIREEVAGKDGGWWKEKGRADEARPGKGKLLAVSTSYGGMTRVRFGGFFPCVGKSRLRGHEAPLSCGWNVDGVREGAKREVEGGENGKPARAEARTGLPSGDPEGLGLLSGWHR